MAKDYNKFGNLSRAKDIYSHTRVSAVGIYFA
jgi:hypothetical protein